MKDFEICSRADARGRDVEWLECALKGPPRSLLSVGFLYSYFSEKREMCRNNLQVFFADFFN